MKKRPIYNFTGINELVLSMLRLKKSTDDSRVQMIQEILDSIDSDHDGKIEIDLVLKVIDAVGRENVKVRLTLRAHFFQSELLSFIKERGFIRFPIQCGGCFLR